MHTHTHARTHARAHTHCSAPLSISKTRIVWSNWSQEDVFQSKRKVVLLLGCWCRTKRTGARSSTAASRSGWHRDTSNTEGQGDGLTKLDWCCFCKRHSAASSKVRSAMSVCWVHLAKHCIARIRQAPTAPTPPTFGRVFCVSTI